MLGLPWFARDGRIAVGPARNGATAAPPIARPRRDTCSGSRSGLDSSRRVLRILCAAASRACAGSCDRGSAAAGVLDVRDAGRQLCLARSLRSSIRFALVLSARARSLGTAAWRGERCRRLPRRPRFRAAVDLWGPVPSLPLMRAVKDQFDPEHTDGAGPVRRRHLMALREDPSRDWPSLASALDRTGRCGTWRVTACTAASACRLPHLPAVGRGDGFTARPDPPDHADPRQRREARRPRPSTSTGASAAWPA